MMHLTAAPIIGALIIIGLGVYTYPAIADDDATPVPPKVGESAAGTDNIVGEYSLITGPDIFLPKQLCTVDPKLSVIQQLQQCKNKRKGWLRL
jgi:hypothetical protein